MIKLYNFIIDNKLIEVRASTLEEAEILSKLVIKEMEKENKNKSQD